MSDDENDRRAAVGAFTAAGVNPVLARSPADALKRLDDGRVECVVVADFGALRAVDFRTLLLEAGFDGPVVAVGGEAVTDSGTVAVPSGDHETVARLVPRLVAHDRIERERDTYRRLKALAADVVNAALDAVGRTATEEAIYEKLMAADEYVFAWLVSNDPTTGARTPTVPVDLDVDLAALGSYFDTDGDIGLVNRAIDEDDLKVSKSLGDGRLSSAIVPLSDEDTVHGALVLYATRPDAFDEAERSLLHRVGRSIGQVFASQQRAELAIDTFTAGFARMLQTHIDAARDALEHASDGTDGDFSLDRLGTVFDSLEWLSDAAPILAGDQIDPDEMIAVDVEEIASTAWDAIGSEWSSLDVERPGKVYANEAALGILFENLFRNSLHATSETTTIEVGGLETGFYVADDGPGIGTAERIHPMPDQYRSSGANGDVGLPVVRRIAGAHGWTVTRDERDQGGMRIEVSGVDRPREP